MVMDSMKDLPDNWRHVDLRKEYGINDQDADMDTQPDTQSSGLSDAVSDSNEDLRREASENDSGVEEENVDATAHANPGKTPKRVMVFTTIMLLV